MPYNLQQDKIDLFASLFKGRNDIYAVRWEKNEHSDYMPAYNVDWSDYKQHKAKGGTFKDYPKKELLPFDKRAIKDHLEGKKTIGIYPLLEDNTSYFIAVDFDKEKWKNTILKLQHCCSEYGIPSYIERSRSGNGGHLWMFFEEPVPAEQSRKIMFELLRIAGIVSHFEKEPSFDRLFPNQNFHSGKGFGNLIALPLHGESVKSHNSVFLEPQSMEPYSDQWDFLENIEKISNQRFKEIYENIFEEKPQDKIFSSHKTGEPIELELFIKNQIFLKKYQLSRGLVAFIREKLNFFNSDYLIKKNIGKSTYKTEKYFNLIEESDEEIMIPRGFVMDLISFCKKKVIPFKIIDQRVKQDEVNFPNDIELKSIQETAIESTRDKDFGVIVSPPGSGKTIIGLKIIAEKGQPALIIVHRQQLFDQWIERIQSFLKIPKKEIGQIGKQKFKPGKSITVAMIQTLSKSSRINEIADKFGTIIIDECHHVPAKTFRETITKFNSYYLYGLTATPKRKNNDQKLIFVYIGNILYKVEQHEDLKEKSVKPEINIKETNLYAPFDYRIDNYETISRILIYDTQRNNLILNDIQENISRFNTILVLTERKAHVEILNLYLKDHFETITIHGEDSERSKNNKIAQIKHGHFRIVISTGQYFGEGMDLDKLDCLFIVYPFAFEGKLVQYIGRIQRSKSPPVIFDYRDKKIDHFEKMFKQRNRYYKKLLK